MRLLLNAGARSSERFIERRPAFPAAAPAVTRGIPLLVDRAPCCSHGRRGGGYPHRGVGYATAFRRPIGLCAAAGADHAVVGTHAGAAAGTPRDDSAALCAVAPALA